MTLFDLYLLRKPFLPEQLCISSLLGLRYLDHRLRCQALKSVLADALCRQLPALDRERL